MTHNRHLVIVMTALLVSTTTVAQHTGATPLSADDMHVLASEYEERGMSDSALYWYERAANDGLVYAQSKCGELYEKMDTPDYAKSVHYYGLAAAQGYNYAMYRLGYFYMIGLGVKQDDALAAHWLREAAEIGYCWGMPQYFYGRYYAPDAEVETWLLRAAAAGCKMAYTELGNKFLTGTAEGNFPLNADSAFHYFSLGADNGDADAFYWLSQCYANGRGCTQSYARAHTLFEQAEQSGSYMARLFRRLNADRQQPQGTRDPSQGGQLTFADDAAYDWYCDACLNQRPQSMYRLARSYLHGTNGVSANAHESGYWMGMAAYGGLVEAQYFLALYFEQSDNPTRAAEWYERGSHSTQYLTDETSYAEYLDLVATCAAALKRLEAKE